MTVVHMSALSGLAPLPEEKAGQINALIRKGRWEELERSSGRGDRGLLSANNYLTAAASAGIVKKVYWVVPGKLLEFSNAVWWVRRFLGNGDTRFRPEDIERMNLDGNCVSGTLSGVAVSICSPDTLPPLPEPVLLDLDAAYLADFSSVKGYSPLRGMKEIFDRLAAKRLRIIRAGITRSDLSSRSIRGYLAAQAGEALKDPAIMSAPTPPELWSMRDAVDTAFSKGKDITPLLRAASKRHPGDRPLALFGAVAAALTGGGRSSLKTLADLCREDAANCPALLYTADELAKRGRPDAAERVLRRALELKAGWPDALLAYGELLYAQRDYRGALTRYQELARLEESWQVLFAIGDCFYFLEQRTDALNHYTRGLALYEGSTGYRLGEREKGSLARLLTLYREREDTDRVKAVRRILEQGQGS